ncbi:unnamed protein product, partial [Meganyctiphanes norvegica]
MIQRARSTGPCTKSKVIFHSPNNGEGFVPKDIFRDEFILCREDLQVQQKCPLGRGYFGMVFEGVLKSGRSERRVAVKTHSDMMPYDEITQFMQEAALMQNIFCHHVMKLIGVVADFAPVYVVMELMENGDLRTYLKSRPRHHVTDQQIVQMAIEAADGMAYLASKKLVHRDLAARNCMLDESLTLKIGDFGLTRNLSSDYYKKLGQGVLPVRWMSPESLQFNKYNTRSDVWSYGVLLWEIATRGMTPYKECGNDEVVLLVVERHATLSIPSVCPAPLQRIMRHCWRYESRDRPTFLSCIKFLIKHLSAQYLSHFEQVSFYHGRQSGPSHHKLAKGASSFMVESSRDSLSENSDDQDLLFSSDLSDNVY